VDVDVEGEVGVEEAAMGNEPPPPPPPPPQAKRDPSRAADRAARRQAKVFMGGLQK
jgi:hypothetical protein